jgi:hypothetical protein
MNKGSILIVIALFSIQLNAMNENAAASGQTSSPKVPKVNVKSLKDSAERRTISSSPRMNDANSPQHSPRVVDRFLSLQQFAGIPGSRDGRKHFSDIERAGEAGAALSTAVTRIRQSKTGLTALAERMRNGESVTADELFKLATHLSGAVESIDRICLKKTNSTPLSLSPSRVASLAQAAAPSSSSESSTASTPTSGARADQEDDKTSNDSQTLSRKNTEDDENSSDSE